MNKKSKFAKHSWWTLGLVGLVFGLIKGEGNETWIYIGVINGAFWGWILGWLFDYITDSFFYQEPIKEVKTPSIKETPKTYVNKSSNHENYKSKPTEYRTTRKEKLSAIVSEPTQVYQAKPKESQKDLRKPKLRQPEKTDKKDILPTSVQETTEAVSEIKYVNYDLKMKERETEFPIIKIPNKKCVVRTHRIGSSKRRGFKEVSFQKAVEYFFSEKFTISGNIRINTGNKTRPYEPDIALIGNCNQNIRIDIEIDEPYAGITRQPTHCIGDDINRDNFFRDRGWLVIRFSEHQVHTQLKECLNYVARIISKIYPEIEIPTELKDISKIADEKVWDVVQAQKWEKENYRETYLNHRFRQLDEEPEILKRGFNSQEVEEEKLVTPTSFGEEDIGKEISFNKQNKHQNDQRIKFYSEKHIYTIDGVPAPSASTIISRFFPEFDMEYWSQRKAPSLGMTAKEVAEMWSNKGKLARDKGTFLHEQIENYYLGINYQETEEFEHFRNFIDDHNDLSPYRSEWRIFDDELSIAGTIDLITSNGRGHDIYDWKRSKKIVNTFDGQPIEQNQWQQGVGNLAHIDDTSYNRYCLQQSLYKFILEKNYAISVDNMFLIVMYPSYNNYYKVKVPYLKKEIEYILQTV